MLYNLHTARTCRVANPFLTSNSSGIAMAGKGRCNIRAHEVARGHIQRLGPRSEMNADRARKLAVEAAREADPVCGPCVGRLWWTGSALANHRAISKRGLRLAGGAVPQMRDLGQHSPGCLHRPRNTPIW